MKIDRNLFLRMGLICLALAGCVMEPSPSGQTGSISFKIGIQQPQPAGLHAFAVDCDATGIQNIIVLVYEPPDENPVKTGNFQCSTHQGQVDGVPAGVSLRVVINGVDGGGTLLYQAEKEDVFVQPGIITDLGPIELTDVLVPTVSSTNPDNNATGVVINTLISSTFSEAMDPLTITTTTFTLQDSANFPVVGTVGYSGTTATFNPTSNLAASTTYTATITTGAMDVAGNALAANYVWSFTTILDTTAPTVSSTIPTIGATGVAVDAVISATFSEAMDPATITTSTFTLQDGVANPVTGTVGYSGSTATFTPIGLLANTTTYTATITTGATDLAGNAIVTNYVWSFTTIPWTQQLGTAGNDVGFGTAVYGSGDIYVTGSTEGGLDGNNNAGLEDLFLVKYDSAGIKQWTQQLGTASKDVALNVAVDGSGNSYVTGLTEGGLDGSNAGFMDLFLVKYSSAGANQWTRQLGSAGYDWGEGVGVDIVGNIYVAGGTSGDLDGNTGAGGDDLFLAKYNSSGVKQWTQQLGTAAYEAASDCETDQVGSITSIYVTGYTSGDLDGNTNAGTGTADLFLIKYDDAGGKQWTRQFGSSGTEVAQGVAADGTGNIYVTGYTDGGLDTNTNAGGLDFFLVKYNSAGVKQWTQQFGTASYDNAQGVVVDGSGNIYVAGWTEGGLDGNINAGMHDLFLVKYDSAGNRLWTRQLGTAGSEVVESVAMDGSGNVYVTGSTQGGLDGNTNAGLKDIFLVKYNSAGVKQ